MTPHKPRCFAPFRQPIVLALAILLLAPIAAAQPPGTPLRVTVTVPPLVWLVAQVAGPEVVVDHLIEVGENPETFQPTDRQITDVARSALFFRIGVEAENGRWLKALGNSGALEVVDLRQGLELRAMAHGTGEGHASGHHHHHPRGAMDPHTWLSPRRLAIMAGTVARHLAEVDPAGAAGYASRATEVAQRLDELDRELRARLAPVEGRAFFVFHPAWGYFADDYGLHQVAIESQGKEPSERELTQLVRRAQDLGMRTLFVEPLVRSSTPAILARTVGARLEPLDPLAANLPANLRHVAERVSVALGPEEEP